MAGGVETVPETMVDNDTNRMEGWQDERRTLELELGERITLDALTGSEGGGCVEGLRDDAGGGAGWLIAQRKGGHRHSIDDVLTAWYALQVSPPVTEHLDLGTGIGTVGLLTLWGMGNEARLTCVEAQEISYRLLRSNIFRNGLESRVDAVFGDLRELTQERKFLLITGSPPYFPEGTGVLPQDSQKAHARFELRGDVWDYARAGAAHLAEDGWLVLCFPTPRIRHALDGVEAAGLRVVSLRDVVPRETLAPLFTLLACRHAAEFSRETTVEKPLTVRWENGDLTDEMLAVRQGFGFLPREA